MADARPRVRVLIVNSPYTMPSNEWHRFLGVVLRVPSLFVLDELCRAAFGMAAFYSHWELDEGSLPLEKTYAPEIDGTLDPEISSNNTAEADSREAAAFFSIVLPFTLSLLLHITAGIAASVIFVLRLQKLKALYLFLFCCASTFLSYQLNVRLVSRVMSSDTPVTVFRSLFLMRFGELVNSATPNPAVLLTLFLQTIQTRVFLSTYRAPCACNVGNLVQVGASTLVLPAMLVSILPADHELIPQLPMICSWTGFCILNYTLIVGIAGIYRSTLRPGYHYLKRYLRHNSITTILQTEWTRLQVPDVLRVFWVMRAVAFTISYVIESVEAGGRWQDVYNLNSTHVENYLQAIMAHGCDTIVAVLGMSSIVHSVCYAAGSCFHYFLELNDDEQQSVGVVLSVLFFILAMQTGLTGLPSDKRVARLCRNFCLVFTALLHFVHRMVSPVLQSLSASRTSLEKHLRPLAVAAVLLTIPVAMLTWLWTRFKLSTWLLAVSAFSLEVVVKTLGTLVIYALFVIDARRTTYWENLDDYIYYIKAVGNGIEFVFGVFLFLNGAWILLFESGGAIRTCMMCIHAYFNIWMEAKNGWDAFIKRRTALGKINSLPDATPEQLSEVDDVCAICYQNMDNAKVTRCGHFFHGNCLRKWLYMQDKCPMCHKVLHGLGSDNYTGEHGDQGQQRDQGEDAAFAEAPVVDNPDRPVQDEVQPQAEEPPEAASVNE